MQDLEQLEKTLLQEIHDANTLEALDNIRVSALGKKGTITKKMKTLSQLSVQERKRMGVSLNTLKNTVHTALAKKVEECKRQCLDAKLVQDRVDISLSARECRVGKLHPILQTMDEITAIFGGMGFSVVDGPDIEDDWHNFQALNIPPEHPARQMQDTFYIKATKGEQTGENTTTTNSPMVLRTHTSPVQIRSMIRSKPPIRIISMGRTFRCDSDITHTPMFHQVEGLVIDKTINFSHLKGTLAEFIHAYFDVQDVPLRFRPSFFPFTEPSAEVDIGCLRERGKVKIGKGEDWLEILGCGMVHPNVLKNCDIDPNVYQGFAFGMGIERVAMLKYGIADLRTFFEADVRWLKHYGFFGFDISSLIRG